jgi:DNA-binding MarR family transcriptional regulator
LSFADISVSDISSVSKGDTRKPAVINPGGLLPLSPVVFSILLALAGSEKHGYAIMKEAALPEGGGVIMGPGTLYGSLDRMMRTGLVEETGVTDNERRRYYRITTFGTEVLRAESARLARVMGAVRRKVVLGGVRP